MSNQKRDLSNSSRLCTPAHSPHALFLFRGCGCLRRGKRVSASHPVLYAISPVGMDVGAAGRDGLDLDRTKSRLGVFRLIIKEVCMQYIGEKATVR